VVCLSEKRLTYLDLREAKSVKTFENEIFDLKGALAVDQGSGKVEKLADVYYRVRTAIGDNQKIIAKRKTEFDELKQVASNERFAKKRKK
jgi:hypothetical protein